MLVTIAVILVILWLLGMVSFHALGAYVHLLLVPCHHHGVDQDHSGPKSTLEFSGRHLLISRVFCREMGRLTRRRRGRWVMVGWQKYLAGSSFHPCYK